MNYQDRRFLMNLYPQQSVGAEIGVWEGVFSSELMHINAPSKLYLIDPFLYLKEYDKSAYGNEKMNQGIMDDKYKAIKKKFNKEIKHGIVSLMRKTSQDALNDIKAQSLDWVYIDGNHSYECTLNDLKGYYHKVKKNGLITGDDYGTIGWWSKGVTKAVNYFLTLKEYKTELFMIKNNQFIIKKL